MKDLLYQNNKIISESIKKLRIRDEHTLEFVSKTTGITLSTLSNIENNKFIPKWDNLKEILSLYNLSLAKFIYLLFPDLITKKSVFLNEDKILLVEKKNEFEIYLLKPLQNENDEENLEINIEPLKSSHQFVFKESKVKGVFCGNSGLIEFINDEQELKYGDYFEINKLIGFKLRNLDSSICKIFLTLNFPEF
jgi:transcriptional regulator with XRE-family HTH domain